MHSIIDEDMKVAMTGATSSISNIDPKQFQDLLQNYQSAVAVECLQYCESIINGLQKQLDEKDAHIASLEGKIVTMSLELASAKAFEDEHKSKRRARASSSQVVVGGNEECQCQCQLPPPPRDEKKKQSMRAARRNTFVGVVDLDPPSPVATPAERRLSRSLPLMDESAKWSFSSLKEPPSSSSKLSIGNIGNYLFGNKRKGGHREQQPEEKETTTKSKSAEETTRQQVGANDTVGATNIPQREGGRRPPNRRRMERQTSSRSFLECKGVVFPNSFEDVLTKGCLDSLRSSLKAMSEAEKRQLKALAAVTTAPEIDW